MISVKSSPCGSHRPSGVTLSRRPINSSVSNLLTHVLSSKSDKAFIPFPVSVIFFAPGSATQLIIYYYLSDFDISGLIINFKSLSFSYE